MATLNEGIAKIETGSTLDQLYNRLLSGFKGAQDEELPDFTTGEYVTQATGEDGVVSYVANEEKIKGYLDDYKDITIKNSAYMLASAIAGTGSGGGATDPDTPSTGGIYVALTGDTMTGKLYTPYGFAAGDNGIKILEVYQTKEDDETERKKIVKITGELHLDSYGLFVGENNVLNYDNDVLSLVAPKINLNGDVSCTGSISVGGLTINQGGIYLNVDSKDYTFYHSGNSNLETVDWSMKDGMVDGILSVKGLSRFKNTIFALNGIEVRVNDNAIFVIDNTDSVNLNADLDITGGLKIQGDKVLYQKNQNVISLSAPKKILNLGDDDTRKIAIQSDIYDDDGEYRLVGKFGDGYFPNSFKAGHLLGNVLFETYKHDEEDSGVVANRWLKFHDTFGPGFYSDGDSLQFKAPFRYNTGSGEESAQITEYRIATLQFVESSSLYPVLNKKNSSLRVSTEADFYEFDKPVEVKNSIGILNSKTRLLDNQLFFGDSVYWLAIEDGVKHYGNVYMTGSVGSVEFSSGFAGSGWKIFQNQLTGNIGATFDELTVRKKMRIYELEVQKQSVTNGSLWVSDACSGDLVEEIV